MRGQKGLFPSRAHRNCLTWSDKMTAVHHLHQQQHQWYSSAGGRWGRNTGDAAEIYQSSYLEREHMTCSNGIGRVLSVSSVSGHAEISFSSHRKRKKPLCSWTASTLERYSRDANGKTETKSSSMVDESHWDDYSPCITSNITHA